jgi:hypothetical protein
VLAIGVAILVGIELAMWSNNSAASGSNKEALLKKLATDIFDAEAEKLEAKTPLQPI